MKKMNLLAALSLLAGGAGLFGRGGDTPMVAVSQLRRAKQKEEARLQMMMALTPRMESSGWLITHRKCNQRRAGRLRRMKAHRARMAV